jgi:hexulose-6-phosphate isomerase
MKKGITYRSFPGGMTGEKDPFEAIAEARRMGYEAIELATGLAGRFTLDADEGFCRRLADHARRAGIDLSSLATVLHWECSLVDADPAVRRRSIDLTRRVLQQAAWLGVDAVLVIPGHVDIFWNPKAAVVPYETAYERSLAAFRELRSEAERLKVALCLENVWNRFLLSPLEFRDFIDRVESPWVGSYFDVGNSFLLGYPEQWIAILGRRIRRVHVKDFRRTVGTIDGFCPLFDGEIDWRRVMEALRAVGYDGYITGEMMPPRMEDLLRTSGDLGRLIALA